MDDLNETTQSKRPLDEGLLASDGAPAPADASASDDAPASGDRSAASDAALGMPDAGGVERLTGDASLDAGELRDDERLEREGRRRPSLERAAREHDADAARAETGQRAKLERIKEELNSVPTLPGVYLWKDKSGQVIYVGKAKQLRARMRQYVNFQDERAKIPLLVDQIDSFDYIVVENEHESLVLEKNLINQHAPFFNADFKDDKSYPFIALTKGDVFPAIKYTREKHRADTKYFGPYTDSRAARDMVDIARRVVPLCATSCADWRQLKRRLEKDPLALMSHDARPCFDAHVGLGPGACCGGITPEDYRVHVKRIERFLSGQHREFVDELQAEMQEAAAELDFERAARIKARIDTINSLTDKQHAVSTRNLDADVVGLFREETVAGVHVFMVREGRIINSNEFVLDRGKDVPDDDLLHMFLLRYYDATTSIPHEVILRDEELFVPWQDTGPVVLPSGSASLYLVKQVRDEAHRFAITFHRELRGKGMTASILDDVTGMGPVRKKALLKAFKSFKNLKSATLEEIKEARVVPVEVAEELYRVLQQYNRERKDERVVGGEAGEAACPPAGEGPAAVESAAVDAAVEAAVQGERARTDTEG